MKKIILYVIAITLISMPLAYASMQVDAANSTMACLTCVG